MKSFCIEATGELLLGCAMFIKCSPSSPLLPCAPSFSDLPISQLPDSHSDPAVQEGLGRIKVLDAKLQV